MSDRRRTANGSWRGLKRSCRHFGPSYESSNTGSQEEVCCIGACTRRKGKRYRGGGPQVHILLNGPEGEQPEKQNGNCGRLHVVLVEKGYG